MKRTVFAWIAAACVAVSGVAFAQEGKPPEGERFAPEQRLEKHLSELGLSSAQMEKVKAILASAKPAREAERTKMREAFQGMQTLLDQDKPDEAAVMRQADKLGELRT